MVINSCGDVCPCAQTRKVACLRLPWYCGPCCEQVREINAAEARQLWWQLEAGVPGAAPGSAWLQGVCAPPGDQRILGVCAASGRGPNGPLCGARCRTEHTPSTTLAFPLFHKSENPVVRHEVSGNKY